MALTKFLDPKNDIAFKRIFSTDRNKDILIHFLNDILGFNEENKIQDVEFLNTIWNAETVSEKQSIVDVFCKDTLGQRYVVEMQVARDKGFEKRALLYASKAYARQAERSSKYPDLKKVFFIAISDCLLFSEDIPYKSIHTIREETTNKCCISDMQFVFIELPKFPKTKIEDLEDIVEKWCYFFKYAEDTTEEVLEKIIKNAPFIQQAYKELEQFRWSDSELIAYEETIMNVQKEEAILEQRLEDAEKKGIEKGIEKGMEKGKEEGKIEMARNMARSLLAAGVPVDVIAQSSGLSVAQVEELQ